MARTIPTEAKGKVGRPDIYFVGFDFTGNALFEIGRILGDKLSTAEILRRIRRLEDMRDHLGRNIQEALAIEVAFLSIFTF